MAEDMIALQATVTTVSDNGSDTVIKTADGWITLNGVTGFDATTIGSIIDTDFWA